VLDAGEIVRMPYVGHGHECLGWLRVEEDAGRPVR